MCNIKFLGPVNFSMLFSPKLFARASLKNYGKTHEKFPGTLIGLQNKDNYKYASKVTIIDNMF